MRISRLIGCLAGNHDEEDTYGSAGSSSGGNNNNDDDYNNSQIVLDIYSVDCVRTFFSKSILCVSYVCTVVKNEMENGLVKMYITRLVNAWILYSTY